MFKARQKILIILVGASLVSSCATAPRKRFLIGAGVGGATGTVGGALFSPNSESRGLNALVFGLVGAIVGGVTGLLIHDDAEIPEPKKLEKNAAQPELSDREFQVAPAAKELPAFVRERLKPVIVEELHEPDTVSEDGSLHEPHKVYRIKRQAELIANPIQPTPKGSTK